MPGLLAASLAPCTARQPGHLAQDIRESWNSNQRAGVPPLPVSCLHDLEPVTAQPRATDASPTGAAAAPGGAGRVGTWCWPSSD